MGGVEGGVDMFFCERCGSTLGALYWDMHALFDVVHARGKGRHGLG